MKKILSLLVIIGLISTLGYASGLKIVGIRDIDATKSVVRLETEHNKGAFSSSEDWKESIAINDLPAKYRNYMFFKKNKIDQEGDLSLKEKFLTVDEFSYVAHLSKKWLSSAKGKIRFILSITNDIDSIGEFLYAPEFIGLSGTHQYYSGTDSFTFKWEGSSSKYYITIEEYNKGKVKYVVNKPINRNSYRLRMSQLKDSCEYILRVRQTKDGEIYSQAASKYFKTYYDQEMYNKRCMTCHGTGYIQEYTPDTPNPGHHTNPPNNGHHTNPHHGHVKGYHNVTCYHCHGLGYTVEYGAAEYFIRFE